MKDKDQPWLGESSYGDAPMDQEANMLAYDSEEWAKAERNRRMIRQGDGYINRQGYAKKIKNAPAVVGRDWAWLEKFDQ